MLYIYNTTRPYLQIDLFWLIFASISGHFQFNFLQLRYIFFSDVSDYFFFPVLVSYPRIYKLNLFALMNISFSLTTHISTLVFLVFCSGSEKKFVFNFCFMDSIFYSDQYVVYYTHTNFNL